MEINFINTIFYPIACDANLSSVKIILSDKNKTNCTVSTSKESASGAKEFLSRCGPALRDFLEQQGVDLMGSSNCEPWNGSCGVNSLLTRDGSVSIGTTYSKAGYKLAVKGGILTEQYKVCSTLWCDYVFDKEYKIMPLYEVEDFISKNKHLPKSKTQKEISQAGGIDATETILSHQEKIEEAFLHLIEIDKQLKSMKQRFPNNTN